MAHACFATARRGSCGGGTGGRESGSRHCSRRRLLGRYGRGPDLETVVLIAGGRAYRKSRALLEILRRLDPPWPLLYGLLIVPRPFADAVYDFVGARRYRWFGTTTSCAVAEGDRARILDE